jgi:hypothetical protein
MARNNIKKRFFFEFILLSLKPLMEEIIFLERR